MKTTRILASVVLAIGLVRCVSAQLPPGWYEADIGSAPTPGRASYDVANGTWVIIAEQSDHYVYRHLKGDGQIVARALGYPCPSDPLDNDMILCPGRKVGDCPHVRLGIFENLTHQKFAEVGLDGCLRWSTGTGFEQRCMPWQCGLVVDLMDPLPTRSWVRMERRGDTFTGSVSVDGSIWQEFGSVTIPMDPNACIGLLASFTAQWGEEIGQVSVNPGTSGPDNNWTVSGTNMYSIPSGNVGIGITNPAAKLDVLGRIRISDSAGKALVELGEGLDYAEGFNVADKDRIGPGSVLVIDPANPGKLRLSSGAYDKKVAGIVAGAKGLGSAVRLGVGRFDHDVALAGRVYCNVDATKAGIEPGDLLTTSPTLGHAMKAVDYRLSQGAILGKAMEPLAKGKKGQILVLVTLQ